MNMRNKLSKLLSGFFLLFLGIVNAFYRKTVQAMVVYASPEMFFEKEAKKNLFFDFVKEYTGLVIFISLLAFVGLIRIIRVLWLKIFAKKKQNKSIPSKSIDELPRQ
jgi:uncharacterized membrane protein